MTQENSNLVDLNKKWKAEAEEALKERSPVSFTQAKRMIDLSRGLVEPTEEEIASSKETLRKASERYIDRAKKTSSESI